MNDELKLLLDLIEYLYENTKDQIEDFQQSFEVDDIEENLLYIDRVNKAIKSMMQDKIILVRALRDKLENG
jgi:flagellin-specific chaperone FliS